ncbi:BREX system ATP-binding domain-containing protein [Accumulibacter sp.]|uniref:BREX system ATP-binding domain-containing protein n=1 Tax=Accumulibacter sp. TaxID=2053492 RepID=UPI0026201010|nr:BREX system ATP-binding domain-containing protein [Accumulibacter sp.]
MAIDKDEAQRICSILLSAPLAPGGYSHFINVGTDWVLDILEREYFRQRLPAGAACFKYLQGSYGSGKTQFIFSLAARAWRNNIATAVVTIGIECPFNSPLAIYRHVMSGFVAPDIDNSHSADQTGIELLLDRWIRGKLAEMGVGVGDRPEPEMRQDLDRMLSQSVMGSPDTQATTAIQRLARSILDRRVGAGNVDQAALQWLKGDAVVFPELKKVGVVERANDVNAFQRLKAVLAYLRKVLGYKGFLIAFDEGTRTGSFKKASVRERQAVENLLTLINESSRPGGFDGAMFLYAATPDFRQEVVSRYVALDARIGGTAFSVGSPMVPFIDLDSILSDDLIIGIARRLREVFARADDVTWDEGIQRHNLDFLMQAEKEVDFTSIISPRRFVYHYCLLLQSQGRSQRQLSESDSLGIAEGRPPEHGE